MNQFQFYQAKLDYETDSWDLFDALSNDEKITVVDTRSPQVYSEEHIPKAINIPHSTMSDLTTSQLDKDRIYVTYCDGIGCNASTKGALNLAKLGFTVKELLGGIDWWKRDGYQTEGKNGRTGKSLPS